VVIGDSLGSRGSSGFLRPLCPYGQRRGFDDMDRELCLSMTILVERPKCAYCLESEGFLIVNRSG